MLVMYKHWKPNDLWEEGGGGGVGGERKELTSYHLKLYKVTLSVGVVSKQSPTKVQSSWTVV